VSIVNSDAAHEFFLLLPFESLALGEDERAGRRSLRPATRCNSLPLVRCTACYVHPQLSLLVLVHFDRSASGASSASALAYATDLRPATCVSLRPWISASLPSANRISAASSSFSRAASSFCRWRTASSSVMIV